MRVDMEFLFEGSILFSTGEKTRSRNSISTSSHVLFCSLYKHSNDEFFDDFPKISERRTEGRISAVCRYMRLSERARALPRCDHIKPNSYYRLDVRFQNMFYT